MTRPRVGAGNEKKLARGSREARPGTPLAPRTKMATQIPQSPANMAVPRERRACGAEVTKPEVRPRLRGLGARCRGWRTVSGAMPRAAGLGRAAALGPLLAAHVVAAIEPISVGIALGAASALTGYLSYTDLYCRFAECCREEQRLNASGRAGPPARGAALTLSWGGREDGRGLGPDSRPASRAC